MAEVVIAGVAIIGQLETICLLIDSIFSVGNNVRSLKGTCADFARFVKEIQNVLKERVSELSPRKEAMFSADGKRRLDKLSEELLYAEVLLRDLQSPLKLAVYTGEAAKKIQRLRLQILESIALLTFHEVFVPSVVQMKAQPLVRDRPDNTPHYIQQCHHHVSYAVHNHNGGSLHLHLHQSDPNQTKWHSGNISPQIHFPEDHLRTHDPETAKNFFRLLSPIHNPSPEYAAGCAEVRRQTAAGRWGN